MSQIDKLTLEVLLGILDEEERDIIVFWAIEGYTNKEIAAKMNEKYKKNRKESFFDYTISVRIHKIVKKLRDYVGVRGDLIQRKKRERLI